MSSGGNVAGVRRFLVVGPGSNAGKTTMGKALVLALREQP